MKEVFFFSEEQKNITKDEVKNIINNFDEINTMIGDGRRNKVKIAEVRDYEINIKSFKTPNFINQISYKFLRKSKAERSYEYANKLLKLGINTPKPIAYLDYSTLLLYKKGFYVSSNLQYDLSYRELINDKTLIEGENILRAFTRFTYKLHESGINFLDHSPGNTLIKINKPNDYDFYLIDLNRMKFQEMKFQDRMKNFAKLSPRDHMLAIMSDEYAKLYPTKTKKEIKDVMSYYSYKFSNRYEKKEAFKKRYFFWRN